MEKKFGRIFLLLIAMAVGFFYARASFAQEDERPKTVQVSPVRYDWSMRAGEERVARINLKNYAQVPYTIKIQIEEFQVSNDSLNANFYVPNEQQSSIKAAYDVINWISTPEMNLVLDSGESRDVFFNVKVPEDTPTGGYFGGIFFQYDPQNPETDTGSGDARLAIHTRAGLLLTLAVKGEGPIMESGLLKSFKALKKIFWQSPVDLKAVFENTGNIPFKTSGKMEIYRGDKKFYDSDIETRLNYPGRFRNYELSWKPDLLDMGPFKVKVHFLSEDESVTADGEASFWLIPWKIVVGVLVAFLVLFLAFFAGRAGGKKRRY